MSQPQAKPARPGTPALFIPDEIHGRDRGQFRWPSRSSWIISCGHPSSSNIRWRFPPWRVGRTAQGRLQRGAALRPQSSTRTSTESGKEFTRVAQRRDSRAFPVAGTAELISLKVLLNQPLSGTTRRKSNKFENRPNIARSFMVPLRFHLYIWFPIACQKELVRKAVAQAQSSLC